MLGDICALPDFTVVKRSQHGFAFDVYPRVAKLEIVLLLQAADSALSPIRSPLMRVATGVECLLEGLSRGIRGYANDVWQIGTSFDVLNVVADKTDGKAFIARIDVEFPQIVEEREFGAELSVTDR